MNQVLACYINGLKKVHVFKGRSDRSEFWVIVFGNLLLGIIAFIVAYNMADNFRARYFYPDIAMVLFQFLSLTACCRRLHDIGYSGLWVLLLVIPLLGLPILIVFWVKDGELEDNRYGENPMFSDI